MAKRDISANKASFWDERVMQFFLSLRPPQTLPRGFAWLHPQIQKETRNVMQQFFSKYYHDNEQRVLLLGINPGRFGAGITGINFTAPRQLSEYCHIAHSLGNGSELSAEFIYDMINAGGGPEWFFKRCYIGSVCPLGLTKDGKNINYYDDSSLLAAIFPFVENCVIEQSGWPVPKDKLICIGGEKNYRFLLQLNKKWNWFEEIIPLPHPRFIMQYRRKEKASYIEQYLQALG
jgi:hypothetical protein